MTKMGTCASITHDGTWEKVEGQKGQRQRVDGASERHLPFAMTVIVIVVVAVSAQCNCNMCITVTVH
jgi:hypothetical protein